MDQLFIYNRTIITDHIFNFIATLYFRFIVLRYFWATNANPDISAEIVVFPKILPDYCIFQYFNEYFSNIYPDISAVFIPGNMIIVKNINIFTLTKMIITTNAEYFIYIRGLLFFVIRESNIVTNWVLDVRAELGMMSLADLLRPRETK